MFFIKFILSSSSLQEITSFLKYQLNLITCHPSFVLRLFQMAFYFFQHLHRIIKNQRIFKPYNSNSLRVEEFGTSGIILFAFLF